MCFGTYMSCRRPQSALYTRDLANPLQLDNHLNTKDGKHGGSSSGDAMDASSSAALVHKLGSLAGAHTTRTPNTRNIDNHSPERMPRPRVDAEATLRVTTTLRSTIDRALRAEDALRQQRTLSTSQRSGVRVRGSACRQAIIARRHPIRATGARTRASDAKAMRPNSARDTRREGDSSSYSVDGRNLSLLQVTVGKLHGDESQVREVPHFALL